jgi:signal transduction histidine kinase
MDLVETQGYEVPSDEVRWERVPGGYASDFVVRLPDGLYHAHTRLGTTAPGVLFARGVLIGAFDLLLMALLWSGGSVARGLSPVPRGATATLRGSFRARVTVALFAFFLAPTVLFGWAAYRTLAREVERTARAISARAVQQAVDEFPEMDLRQLASRAGSEILYYYNSGELAQASSPEAIGLGVYPAWLSPPIFRVLQSGEEPQAQEVRRLGNEQYLFAYHRGRPAGILAVPTPLSSGETALRQQELAHLILFAALIGAVLSFALSIAVGRSLAGPIGRLRRAAANVGAGRLRVRLPEHGGEFGELFDSFNRMVRRLRRARVRERETARVLAWGEMARQVAHEIKNPLTPIKLSVQHLRRAYRDGLPEFDAVLEENVAQILTEIDRLTEISREFSRYGALERKAPLEAIQLADVVREALTLYRVADDAITYRDEVAADLPPVVARRGEMKEVLLNLVENAREALDGRGTILVRAASSDGRVDVAVEDDGPGIPPELLARVFDPHFSTRSTGTGLGLAIVRRLVEGWGGTVNAQSDPGRGTVVRIRLQASRTGGR